MVGSFAWNSLVWVDRGKCSQFRLYHSLGCSWNLKGGVVSLALISSIGFSPSTVVLVGIALLFLCRPQIPRDVLIRCTGLFTGMKSGWCSGSGRASVVSKWQLFWGGHFPPPVWVTPACNAVPLWQRAVVQDHRRGSHHSIVSLPASAQLQVPCLETLLTDR